MAGGSLSGLQGLWVGRGRLAKQGSRFPPHSDSKRSTCSVFNWKKNVAIIKKKKLRLADVLKRVLCGQRLGARGLCF